MDLFGEQYRVRGLCSRSTFLFTKPLTDILLVSSYATSRHRECVPKQSAPLLTYAISLGTHPHVQPANSARPWGTDDRCIVQKPYRLFVENPENRGCTSLVQRSVSCLLHKPISWSYWYGIFGNRFDGALSSYCTVSPHCPTSQII
jgi:hypothetical protein